METLKKNKKYIAIIELVFAIVIAIILYPIGFIFAIIQPIFFRNNKRNLVIYLYDFFKQIYIVIMYLFHHIALTIDILGNIIVGDFIELFVTTERETLFGNKQYTISESLGYLENRKSLTIFGKKVIKFINFIFGKNHCINAYLNK